MDRLMVVETDALTGATGALRDFGVLTLPIHDSLLVPMSGLGHVGSALVGAFSYFASRVRIRWDTAPTPDVSRA